MHVGERPYVVVGTQTINISTHGLNLDAMTGMLAQLLPADALSQLEEFGAVEYRVPQAGDDRFTIVAARGGDDVWIEIRRRQKKTEAPKAGDAPMPVPEVPAVVEAPEVVAPQEQPAVFDPPPVIEVPMMPAPANEVLTPAETAATSHQVLADFLSEAEPIIEYAPPVDVPQQADAPDEPAPSAEPPAEEPLPLPVFLREPAHEVAPEPEQAAPLSPAIEPEPMSAPELEVIAEPAPLTIAASVERERQLEPEQELEPELATVLPMTRTVRIEVPPRAASSRAATDIERLMRVAAARGASALFLTSESRPWMRVDGDLRQLESEPALSKADVERAVMEIAPESGHESIGRGEATEWLAEFEGVGRIRCTTFADHRGPGMLLRMIATRAATAEQLGLSREVQALATEPQGLVLVAGPRTNGKSTLLSALVDLVNRQRAEFVITLERQIRLVHEHKSALVSQREIRGGADETVAAARAALRENPDVLVVDDLVSPHMVPLLLTAASEGLLVFVSINAPSTADAVQRFIELAPPEMRKAVQSATAESFRGAIAQVLLKKVGGGLIAAREVLLATAPVTRVISEGQLAQLPLALESGRKHGMVSFTEALVEFVRSGTVDVREAFRKTPDRDRLLEHLKRDGVDTSVVERLA